MSRISELKAENEQLRKAPQEALNGSMREPKNPDGVQWSEELRAYQDGINAVMANQLDVAGIQWPQNVQQYYQAVPQPQNAYYTQMWYTNPQTGAMVQI